MVEGLTYKTRVLQSQQKEHDTIEDIHVSGNGGYAER